MKTVALQKRFVLARPLACFLRTSLFNQLDGGHCRRLVKIPNQNILVRVDRLALAFWRYIYGKHY